MSKGHLVSYMLGELGDLIMPFKDMERRLRELK